MHEEAKTLYDSGMSLTDIAAKLEKPLATIKTWKRREKWNPEMNLDSKRDSDSKAIQKIMQNTKLTERQKLFCIYFAKSLNATKSYQKAYECNYQTANAHGYLLLSSVVIKAEINRLKEARYTIAFLKPSDIFQKYMDIALADMTDYIKWEPRDIETDDGIETIQNMTFVPSDQIDGTIICEVRTGKSDSIKLSDRMKALDWLTEHMNMATEEQQAKLDLIRTQARKLNEDDDTKNNDDGVVIVFGRRKDGLST